ncbi:rhodanese-like domain-containing protein [Phaeobacter marinintestinus]|uniref:rhodanese-like domain-containing protein n=1 Tax=Falsiphaeobacter marinintestinus TaxID=1492905 RepID=UPI001648601F|nr:rhodanese-like domain-containing protein [Phaeobacter marinintestinus]
MSGGKASARAAQLALAFVLISGSVSAQSAFGGSFDESFTPPTTQPVPQSPPQGTNDGFGGSFDNGAPSQPDAGGGSGFSGGGFESDFVPPRPGQEPEQQAQPEPEPTPPQRPPVDDSIAHFEGRDFGVPPTSQLRSGQMHAPTPSTVPGASVVSTSGLVQAMNDGIDLVLVDVLGGDYRLPGALMAPALSTPGHFNDRLQQQAKTWLGEITRGDTDYPIILYCADPYCWLSYNAVLRTVAAGFTNVYWYRGGLQAWQMAGLRLEPSGF